jgi:YVTN family beta-propeller protein
MIPNPPKVSARCAPSLSVAAYCAAAVAFLLASPLSAETAVATVPVGSNPRSIAVNPITNVIYVANSQSNNVTIIDGKTDQAATVAVGSVPSFVAVNPVTNKIYVANSGDNTVTVLDGATNNTITVSAGTSPSAVAVNSITNRIYVINKDSSNVTVIDGATNSTNSVRVGSSPNSIALNPVTNKIYVTNFGDNSVSVIDGHTNTVTNLAAGANPGPVVLNAATNKIYVANYGDGNLTVIDGSTNTLTSILLGVQPASSTAMALNPVTNKLYLANDRVGLTKVDLSSNAWAGNYAVGAKPMSIVVNTSTNRIYVTLSQDNSVCSIDGANDLQYGAAVGSAPDAIAVNPVTNKVYTANTGSNDVSVVDAASYLILPMGGASTFQEVRVNPATGTIYIADTGANRLIALNSGLFGTSADTGADPLAFEVNPFTNNTYVANAMDNTVSAIVFSGFTNTTTTIPVGNHPLAVAINAATNKTYVVNGGSANVTVIDGRTYSTASVAVGAAPTAVGVNPATNKIYVANQLDNTVTIIDGGDNSTTAVAVGKGPSAIAVNAVTNKIYVVNSQSNNVTVIDGLTAATASVPVGTAPVSVAVNPDTNKVYVGNNGSATVTVINGFDNSTATIPVGPSPAAIAVNSASNKVYVGAGALPNPYDIFGLTVIDGATGTTQIVAQKVESAALAVNPILARVYSVGLENDATQITEQGLEPLPLTTNINPLSNDRTTNSNPAFTFGAQSSDGSTPSGVYFAVDSWQNAWTAAKNNNGTYTGTLPAPLTAGVHILYAFAINGEAASSAQTGSPMVGAIQAYQFLVALQTISFDPIAAQLQGTILTLGASATSGLPVSYRSSTPAVCTVSGSTASLLAAGACTITASQAGNESYSAAIQVSQTFAVVNGQTITFPAILAQNVGATITLTATSSSGLPVTYTSFTPNNCSISGNTAYLFAVGECSIQASQPGNASYSPAANVSQEFGIVTPQIVNFPQISTQVVGSQLTLTASVSSGELLAYSSLTLDVCTVTDNLATFLAPGNCTITATQPFSSPWIEAGSAAQTFRVVGAGSMQFVPVAPCRVVDTRDADGSFGGPEIPAAGTRSFAIPQSPCGIPASAAAYSLNITAVPTVPLGFLSIWPTGLDRPYVSTINSWDGRIKANAAIVDAGTDGAVSVYVSDASHVVLDINGYFVLATESASLAFYPVTPCRIADTRNPDSPFGGPSMTAGETRSFNIPASACNIPGTAGTYSLNFTVVPHGTFGYLSTWPAGQAQPYVSTLNAFTGEITANAALVPSGVGGAISVYVTHDADLVIDVSGYFAPAATGGLSLYNLSPCRALDTRSVGDKQPFVDTLTVNVGTSRCEVPLAAQALVMNATTVPDDTLGFLAFWPHGETRPYVSTLNAFDGSTTSNMAIVPMAAGSIDAYASDPTQLIVDVSGYFAP